MLTCSKEKKLKSFYNNYRYTCIGYIFYFMLIDLYNGLYVDCY